MAEFLEPSEIDSMDIIWRALTSEMFWLAMLSALVFTGLIKAVNLLFWDGNKELKKELEQRKKELDEWEKKLSSYFENNMAANKVEVRKILEELEREAYRIREDYKLFEYLKQRNDQLYKENQNFKARLDRCKQRLRKLEGSK